MFIRLDTKIYKGDLKFRHTDADVCRVILKLTQGGYQRLNGVN